MAENNSNKNNLFHDGNSLEDILGTAFSDALESLPPPPPPPASTQPQGSSSAGIFDIELFAEVSKPAAEILQPAIATSAMSVPFAPSTNISFVNASVNNNMEQPPENLIANDGELVDALLNNNDNVDCTPLSDSEEPRASTSSDLSEDRSSFFDPPAYMRMIDSKFGKTMLSGRLRAKGFPAVAGPSGSIAGPTGASLPGIAGPSTSKEQPRVASTTAPIKGNSICQIFIKKFNT